MAEFSIGGPDGRVGACTGRGVPPPGFGPGVWKLLEMQMLQIAGTLGVRNRMILQGLE